MRREDQLLGISQNMAPPLVVLAAQWWSTGVLLSLFAPPLWSTGVLLSLFAPLVRRALLRRRGQTTCLGILCYHTIVCSENIRGIAGFTDERQRQTVARNEMLRRAA